MHCRKIPSWHWLQQYIVSTFFRWSLPSLPHQLHVFFPKMGPCLGDWGVVSLYLRGVLVAWLGGAFALDTCFWSHGIQLPPCCYCCFPLLWCRGPTRWFDNVIYTISVDFLALLLLLSLCSVLFSLGHAYISLDGFASSSSISSSACLKVHWSCFNSHFSGTGLFRSVIITSSHVSLAWSSFSICRASEAFSESLGHVATQSSV